MQEKRRRGSRSGRNKLTVNYLAESTTAENYQIIADYLNKQDGTDPLTAEDIKERMDYFAHYTSLIQDGEEVIGLGDCYVSRLENLVYGENLLIAPAYQGMIYGGSFLFTILDAVQNFFKKEAGTSPNKMISSVQAGNLRAGKLYERLGYFDMDDSSNRIQNFIPFIYDYPFAKRFFAAQEVELVHCWKYYNPAYEEMLTEMKIKTFPYAFKTKEGLLRVILDGISERPIWVEDDQVLLACWIAEQEVFVGVGKEVNWLIQNRSSDPVEFALHSYGNGGLNFELEESVTLMPGERRVVTRVLEADWVDDSELNTVETEIAFGDQVVRLRNGYRLRELVQYRFERDLTRPLRSGKQYHRSLSLFNNYFQPIEGTIVISKVDGLELSSDQKFSFNIKPNKTEKMDLDFVTLNPGVGKIVLKCTLTIDAVGEDSKIVVEQEIDLELGVLEVDGLLVWKTESNLTVAENDNYALIMANPNLDRSLYLLDKSRNERVLKFLEEEMGPKFVPEFVHQTRPQFSIVGNTIIEKDGKITLHTELEYRLQQNLFLIREYTISRSNAISIDYRLINRSAKEINIGIMSKLRNGWLGADVTLPLDKGMVVQKCNRIDYPGTAYDVSFAENWTALEYENKVLGIIWGSGRISYSKSHNLPQIGSGLYHLKPGEQVQLPTMYVYYGGGTADEVRNYYGKIGYGGLQDLPQRETLDLKLAERQLVMNQKEASFDLQVDRAIDFLENRWIQGNLLVTAPESWWVEIVDQRLKVKLPDDVQSGLYSLTIAYDASTLKKSWPIKVLVTDDRGTSEVCRQEIDELIQIDNGKLKFQVSPGFRERIVSLTMEDEEYLCTTYPEPTAYHKEAPWFGGIGYFSTMNNWIRQEVYSAEQQIDESIWQGVGFRYISPQNPEISLEMEYLTGPGSPILAVHGKVVNRSEKLFTEQITIESNLTNLQDSEMISAFIYENDRLVQLKCQPEKEKYYEIITTQWAAVETGKGNLMVAINPENNHQMGVKNWGAFGIHLAIHQSISLLAGFSKDFTSFFILEKDLVQAEQYRNLKPFVMRGES